MDDTDTSFESGNRHMRWLSQKAREIINEKNRAEARLRRQESENSKTPEQKKAEADLKFKNHYDAWKTCEERERLGEIEYSKDFEIIKIVADAFKTHGFTINQSDRSEAVYIKSGRTTVRLACHLTVPDGRREYEDEVLVGKNRRDGSYSTSGRTVLMVFVAVARKFTKKERSLK